MVRPTDLSPSATSDPATLADETTALVDNGRWKLCLNGRGLERDFRFRTFKAAWDFMNTIAAECKRQRHHPEWTNVYNRTSVRWTTHDPVGLSGKDTAMARFCDEVGAEGGEVVEGAGEGEAESCCGGKGKEGG